MPIFTYEDVTPSLIVNTTMQKRFIDGVHKQYLITANDGYVLHDNTGDWTEIDEITGDEIVKQAVYTGTVGCAASYDFAANPREFYAIPENEAPANQIFGDAGNNNHEIM